MDEIDAPAPVGPVWGAKKAFYSLVAFFLPQILLAVPVGIIWGNRCKAAPTADHRSAVMLMASTFLGTIFGGLVVFRDIRRSFPGPIASGALLTIGWARPRARTLWLAAGVGVGFSLLYLGALAVFPPLEDQKVGPMARLLASGGWALHVWAIGAVMVAPIVEEFVFRGVLLKGLSASWGVWVAGPLVTLIFVSLHLPEVVHYPPALIVLTACSIALLVARLATKSLVSSIAMHVSYNVGLVVTVYASRAMLQ